MMSSRIAVVALNIHIFDKGYAEYIELPAAKKIEYIKNRIINICIQLEKTEPYSKWYIVWREHGITSETGQSVTTKIKHLLKAMIQELTQQYPALTILSGTILKRKTYKASTPDNQAAKKAKKIRKLYQD